MKKTCPACGAPVLDPSKQFCSKCETLPQVLSGKLSREDFEQISQTVSARLKGDWKFKAQIAGAVIVLVLAIVGVIDAIVGFNLKEKMAAHFQALEYQATNNISTSLAKLDADVHKTLSQVDSQMRSNIAERFQTTNIQVVIQNVAGDEAKRLLEKEVQPAVTSFKEDALFIRTIARAQGYDFKAYQDLLKIGKVTNENAKLANQVLDELDRSLARERSDFTPQRRFIVIRGTNRYEGPFTSDELAVQFKHIANDKTAFNREGFVNTANDLKQSLFLGSLITLFTNETDLGVADRLTIAISAIANEDFRPRDFERILTWWTVHQTEYTNWPIAIYERGMEEFSSGRYQQAVDSFCKVLEIDSTADISRAHAIACCWEAGQTNRALQLSKEFKNPSARWAQWANAKGDLDSGNVSNATVRFYSITTNFPSMPRLPDRTSHIFRKIDWKLFDQLGGVKIP